MPGIVAYSHKNHLSHHITINDLFVFGLHLQIFLLTYEQKWITMTRSWTQSVTITDDCYIATTKKLLSSTVLGKTTTNVKRCAFEHGLNKTLRSSVPSTDKTRLKL